MLEDIRDFGLAAGAPLVETAPVAQSTDSYEKHVRRYNALYAEVW